MVKEITAKALSPKRFIAELVKEIWVAVGEVR